ncbi:MAG: AbrB/MazE/SpoVT family DNA-binding domain-containing protein [Nanoarchaeota archaeon]|nr:AbrB/MazE/SpoVT family DNA-binding domain-containing protein [Nanoarchaeota archaeon]
MTETMPRRLIKFGNSSYIISLPKDWITKHKLKKGDIIHISENVENELTLSPKDNLRKSEENPITFDIDDKTTLEIQREITSAYINNYTEIILKGKSLGNKKEIITRIVGEKSGIEITEEGPSQVIIRDIFDFESVSFERIMRRLDNIIRSMFEEIVIGLKGSEFKDWTVKELYRADSGANKIYFLLLKVIRKCQEDSNLMKKMKLSNKSVSDASWVVLQSEYIGDELKRIAKFVIKTPLKEAERKQLFNIINTMHKEYLDTMNAYHKDDRTSAQKVANNKDRQMDMCNKFFETSNHPLKGNITEKLKGISGATITIAKIIAY